MAYTGGGFGLVWLHPEWVLAAGLVIIAIVAIGDVLWREVLWRKRRS